MRAIIQDRYGPAREALHLSDLPAEQPGDDEVIVRMEAAALHIADLKTIEGHDGFRWPLPRTPGFEGVGRVVRVGSGVSSLRAGERVFPALGSGTLRDEVRCKAEGCIPAPEGDPVQLSLLTVNGATAEVLVEDFADLKRGDWLIQNAANSNCGRYVIRLAKLKGVRTVNVVRREDLVAELRALGGDVVLVDGPDLAMRVAAAVGGAPIRVGFDAVAGPATQRIAECLAPGSTLASYGTMTRQRCEIDFFLLFRNDIRLVGVSFARQFQLRRTAADIRAMYARLAAHMARGELIAKIAGVYGLEDTVAACERAALTGTDRDGKVIIGMDS